LRAATAVFRRSRISGRRDRGARMRVPATQAWPLLAKPTAMTVEIALSRSASGRMIFGRLPPSSRVTRFIDSAAARMMERPTAVEPVKVTLAISGCDVSSAPTTSPRPVTILNTPAGRPASCRASVRTCVWMALISLGLMTTVQPAARAVASLLQMEPKLLSTGLWRRPRRSVGA